MGKYIHPAEKVMKKDRTIDSSSRFRERGKKKSYTHPHIHNHQAAFVHSVGSGRPPHISVLSPCLIFHHEFHFRENIIHILLLCLHFSSALKIY